MSYKRAHNVFLTGYCIKAVTCSVAAVAMGVFSVPVATAYGCVYVAVGCRVLYRHNSGHAITAQLNPSK